MLLLCLGIPWVGLASALRNILGAIEKGCAQPLVGLTAQVHHVLDVGSRAAIDEQARLPAATGLAGLRVTREPIARGREADRKIVTVAQSHAQRAVRPSLPRPLPFIFVAVVIVIGVAVPPGRAAPVAR